MKCREDGCNAPESVVDDDGWCPGHGPDGSKRMAELGRRGAEKANERMHGPPALPIQDLPDPTSGPQALEKWFSAIALALATGDLDSKTANSLRSNLKELRKTRESRLTEEKLDALEARMTEIQEGLEDRRKPI